VGGVIAGIMGYATDLAAGAIIDAFAAFNPLFIVLGVVFAAISFMAGISEAYAAGASFSLGIIAAGFWLKDTGTILSGFLALTGFFLSFLKR